MLTIASDTGRKPISAGPWTTASVENAADPAHAELMQLGRPQRPHAGGDEDGNALGHCPENLLVPDCGRTREKAVDDSDRPRPAERGAIDVALRDRRQ
jgi:hypothetical protein